MAPRLVKSLATLRKQIDDAFPNRSKRNDGWIASAEHRRRSPVSDHNEEPDGTVDALDITHDPANGVDCEKIAEALRASRDRRISYIIWRGRICSSTIAPWTWRPSKGHYEHIHISANDRYQDDTAPWDLGITPKVTKSRFLNITATVFGGAGDAQSSAYGGVIDPDKFGVSLPARFVGVRPLVRTFYKGKSVDSPIVDVGPWNISDEYWKHGGRPLVEQQFRNKTPAQNGRVPTNTAAIDITPATARAHGIPPRWKGLLDWEFV